MDGESAHTCGVYERETLNKSYGVYAGNIKPLPASRILAHSLQIHQQHIASGFGKLRAIPFVGAPRNTIFPGANQIGEIVSFLSLAGRAIESRGSLGLRLCIKSSFVH